MVTMGDEQIALAMPFDWVHTWKMQSLILGFEAKFPLRSIMSASPPVRAGKRETWRGSKGAASCPSICIFVFKMHPR